MASAYALTGLVQCTRFGAHRPELRKLLDLAAFRSCPHNGRAMRVARAWPDQYQWARTSSFAGKTQVGQLAPNGVCL
jgi:hypothetical protein